VGPARDVMVDTGVAFLASEVFGLSTVDVSNPNQALLLGTADVPFFGEQVAVSGAVGLVAGTTAEGFAHLWLLDISSAEVPVLLGEMATAVVSGPVTGMLDLKLNSSATMAVAAMGTAGLWVMDVSNPQAMSVVGTLDTPGIAYGVALNSAGTLAYVADGSRGLSIISVSTPTAPTQVGSLSLGGVMRDVDVSGSLAFLANQQGTLEVVSVGAPSLPRWLSRLLPSGFTLHVAVEFPWVALLTGDSSNDYLDIVDVSAPLTPVLSGTAVLGPVGTGKGVDFKDGRAYVAADGQGLKIYDTAATIEEIVDDECVAGSIAETSGVVALLGEDEPTGTVRLKMIDVSVVTAPRLQGELQTTETTGLDVTLNQTGTLAVTAMGPTGVWTVDLSNPAVPVHRGTYNTPGFAYAADLEGNLAYVADGLQGLQIVDVSTPTAPAFEGAVSVSGTIMRDVVVSGTTAYMANQQGTLEVIDVTPGQRGKIGSTGVSGFAFHVALDGAQVAMITTNAGAGGDFLDILNVSVPTNPQLQGSALLGPAGTGKGVVINGGRVYVAANDDGTRSTPRWSTPDSFPERQSMWRSIGRSPMWLISQPL
jgi:hypothetical protein